MLVGQDGEVIAGHGRILAATELGLTEAPVIVLNYGVEERVIHTFVRLLVPSPVPDAEVIATVVEGEWPDYPEEMFAPGRFSPTAPVSGDWTR